LKRGTAVSWGYKAFGTREASWGSKTKHITDAFIEEISVLRLLNPAEKLAKVLWVGEIAETPAAVRATSDRAAAGDDFDHCRPPIFDELEKTVGYRVTHENFEAANTEASRTPLDRLYDEVYGRQRVGAPAVIVRHGIGKVLGVR
jgi:hypothetical protein